MRGGFTVKFHLNELTLISVPTEMLEEAGITAGSVIQTQVANGRLIVEAVTAEDYDCDGNCDGCPFADECSEEE